MVTLFLSFKSPLTPSTSALALFSILFPLLATPLVGALCAFHLMAYPNQPDRLSRSFVQIGATPMTFLITSSGMRSRVLLFILLVFKFRHTRGTWWDLKSLDQANRKVEWLFRGILNSHYFLLSFRKAEPLLEFYFSQPETIRNFCVHDFHRDV